MRKHLHISLRALQLSMLLSALMPLAAAGDTTAVATDSLDRMIGQMIAVGYRGLVIKPSSPVLKDIAAGRVGTVVIYDKLESKKGNPWDKATKDKIAKLVAGLKQAAPEPLLAAIDQEGGMVNRLKRKYGFPRFVSQQRLGQWDNLDSTRAHAERTALALVSLGFNVNLAPVLDVDLNPKNQAVGGYGRCYSKDPAAVARHGLAAVREFRKHGIVCAVKHFPGHGSAGGDSHGQFVNVTAAWSEKELVPFQCLIDSGAAEIVMTAHTFNAGLDPLYPATISARTIDGLLRRTMGFDGLVISDAMNMRAISDSFARDTAVALAVNAGVDILLFITDREYDAAIAAAVGASIRSMVEQGTIPRERIEESYGRIMALKRRWRSPPSADSAR